MKVSVRPECFTGKIEEFDWPQRKKYDEFDFGYVLTVHKAQGSQWDDVVLFDESFAFPDSRERWLYTGITRAAKRLTVVVCSLLPPPRARTARACGSSTGKKNDSGLVPLLRIEAPARRVRRARGPALLPHARELAAREHLDIVELGLQRAAARPRARLAAHRGAAPALDHRDQEADIDALGRIHVGARDRLRMRDVLRGQAA